MIRSRFFAGLVLWALATPAFAQGIGGGLGGGAFPSSPGGFNAPGAGKKSGDTIRPPSNPGIAEPLDIRIQGEGISLPPGVSEDEPVSKPADDRAPQSSPAPENPSPPGAKRP